MGTLAVTHARSIKIEKRDLDLLRDLFESRVMNLPHAAALHFRDSMAAATKRVQKLKAAGLVKERPRRFNERSVLYLSAAGLSTIRAEGFMSDYPALSGPYLQRRARVSDSTLKHELQVMDVKAALVRAIRQRTDLRFETFITWPLLLEFSACRPDGIRVSVKPDGFLKFHQQESDGTASTYRFFVEVDRGTEVQETLAIRAACYRDYYRSGEFALRCGGSRSKPEEYPFRILFVFASAERRNNAAERMLLLTEPIAPKSFSDDSR